MLRPNSFGFNTETKYTNPFQNEILEDEEFIRIKAVEEFDHMVEELRSNGLNVVVFDDVNEGSPDAVFMNSWVSVFPDNKAAIYPIFTENRREERRIDIINDLREIAKIDDIYDLTFFEKENKFLESTSSLVFDYYSKIAYASISSRTDENVINYLCDLLGYESFVFSAYDFMRRPICHTNIILSIARDYAIICLDAIEDLLERTIIRKKIEHSGKEIIEITLNQVQNFSGNCLEVFDSEGKSKLVMSRTAYHSLRKNQADRIEKYSEIILVNVSIIERIGGGSVCCMMMGVNC